MAPKRLRAEPCSTLLSERNTVHEELENLVTPCFRARLIIRQFLLYYRNSVQALGNEFHLLTMEKQMSHPIINSSIDLQRTIELLRKKFRPIGKHTVIEPHG